MIKNKKQWFSVAFAGAVGAALVIDESQTTKPGLKPTLYGSDTAVSGLKGALGASPTALSESAGLTQLTVPSPLQTLKVISFDTDSLAEGELLEVRFAGIDPIIFLASKITQDGEITSHLGSVIQNGMAIPATITVSGESILATLPSSEGVIEVSGSRDNLVARYRQRRIDSPQPFQLALDGPRPTSPPEALCKNC